MTGTVTISMEIELGWGYHDTGDFRKLSDDRIPESKALSRLLRLCDDLTIPITFDVVGHLLLEDCDGTHPGPHPTGWFSSDPGTDLSTDPLFYAPDLIHEIVNADVDHEIGTHTFSHALFDTSSPEIVEWEMTQVKQVHRAAGLDPPVSLVPPRNQSPPLEHVSDHGIQVVRQKCQDAPASTAKEYFWNLFRTTPVKQPRRKNGVLETYVVDGSSLTAGHLNIGQKPAHFSYRPIPIRARKWLQHRSFSKPLESCIREHSAVHYWTHLHDLANPMQWSVVERSLRILASHRRKGNINIAVMGQLVDEI